MNISSPPDDDIYYKNKIFPPISFIRAKYGNEIAWFFIWSYVNCVLFFIVSLFYLIPILIEYVSYSRQHQPQADWYSIFFSTYFQTQQGFKSWSFFAIFNFLLLLIVFPLFIQFIYSRIAKGYFQDPFEGRYRIHHETCVDRIEYPNGPPSIHQQSNGRKYSLYLFIVLLLVDIVISVLIFWVQTKINNFFLICVTSLLLSCFQFIWMMVTVRTTQLEHHLFKSERSKSLFRKVFIFNVATEVLLIFCKQIFYIIHVMYELNDKSLEDHDCSINHFSIQFSLVMITRFVTSVIFNSFGSSIQIPFVKWLNTKIHFSGSDPVPSFLVKDLYAKLAVRFYVILLAGYIFLPLSLFAFLFTLVEIVYDWWRIRTDRQVITEPCPNEYFKMILITYIILWLLAVCLPVFGSLFVVHFNQNIDFTALNNGCKWPLLA
jgi:hypothetical protein